MAGYIGTQAVSVNTTSATITGDASIGGDLSLGDSDKALFGAGSDFEIYHDGTNSYLDNNTGALFMRNNGSIVIEDLSGNNIIRGVDGGAVDLYHNGDAKLTTSATGVTVTGKIISDGGIDIDNFNIDGTSISLSSGGMTINAADVRIKNVANNETMLQCDDDGAVNLFNNNDLCLSTATSGAVTIVNGLSLTNGDLTVAQGHGINFAAQTQSSASTGSELLNHYEEGTFTPVIDGASTSGTYELAAAVGKYTRVGGLLHIEWLITTASSISAGGSGYLRISGFPFVYPTGAAKNLQTIVLTAGVAFTGSYLMSIHDSSAAADTMFFVGVGNDGSNNTVAVGAIGAGDTLRGSFSYMLNNP